MISRIVLVTVLAAAALVVTGCGGSDASTDDRTRVVAAFYPLAYLAERIGGDSVSVLNLTPAGAEPHDLELSARDVQALRDADLVLYLGGGFQPALERALASRSSPSLDLLPQPAAASGRIDPHVWLDPLSYASMARRVGRRLGRPSAAFAARAEQLDRDFREGLRGCLRRDVVTSHAAFGHLAERYDLRQLALTGISPEAEPSPRDLEALVEAVRSSEATTVFFETLVPPDLARTVAREADASTAVLNPLEGLTDEELARGEDYFSVMRRNLETLREALGCR